MAIRFAMGRLNRFSAMVVVLLDRTAPNEAARPNKHHILHRKLLDRIRAAQHCRNL
jgi:hypothetical protein